MYVRHNKRVFFLLPTIVLGYNPYGDIFIEVRLLGWGIGIGAKP